MGGAENGNQCQDNETEESRAAGVPGLTLRSSEPHVHPCLLALRRPRPELPELAYLNRNAARCSVPSISRIDRTRQVPSQAFSVFQT